MHCRPGLIWHSYKTCLEGVGGMCVGVCRSLILADGGGLVSKTILAEGTL